jgi:pimeloyl-ACP methyl ester carboxylesterase
VIFCGHDCAQVHPQRSCHSGADNRRFHPLVYRRCGHRYLVFHGEAHRLTPGAHAHHTAEIVPTAKLEIRADRGHISTLTEIPALAATLVAPLR